MNSADLGATCAIAFVLASLTCFIRHLVWTIGGLASNSFEAGQIALAALGVIFPPVGTIHGMMLFLGIGA